MASTLPSNDPQVESFFAPACARTRDRRARRTGDIESALPYRHLAPRPLQEYTDRCAVPLALASPIARSEQQQLCGPMAAEIPDQCAAVGGLSSCRLRTGTRSPLLRSGERDRRCQTATKRAGAGSSRRRLAMVPWLAVQLGGRARRRAIVRFPKSGVIDGLRRTAYVRPSRRHRFGRAGARRPGRAIVIRWPRPRSRRRRPRRPCPHDQVPRESTTFCRSHAHAA